MGDTRETRQSFSSCADMLSDDNSILFKWLLFIGYKACVLPHSNELDNLGWWDVSLMWSGFEPHAYIKH